MAAQQLGAFCTARKLPLTIVAVDGWAPDVAALWRERTSTDAQGAVLVRPDGHVAWISHSRPDQAGLAKLEKLAQLWV
ncbi:MAG TPA: hypothetical protein VN154_13070 [Rhizomicrobium sp.]|nr:hypothetical protein [Rhizomicrobium sp.]